MLSVICLRLEEHSHKLIQKKAKSEKKQNTRRDGIFRKYTPTE